MISNMWAYIVTMAAAAALVQGHGRVLDPPGRGSLWRLGYNTRANYDDDGLNCGGFSHQHYANGGKCGLCGDPFDAALPRAHEHGGIYDAGIIAATYEAGSIVPITVQITAHHRGYWEFRICPDRTSAEQSCYDQYLLELEVGGTKYYPEQGSNTYVVNYRIPSDLTCDNCVLQWRYTCGNNWGVCSDGTQGLGCGIQETFSACSDIAITGGTEENHQFIPVESLLLPKWNELGLLNLMLRGYVKPHWPTPTSSTVAPPRQNSKRRKLKGKKKTKPYNGYSDTPSFGIQNPAHYWR